MVTYVFNSQRECPDSKHDKRGTAAEIQSEAEHDQEAACGQRPHAPAQTRKGARRSGARPVTQLPSSTPVATADASIANSRAGRFREFTTM